MKIKINEVEIDTSSSIEDIESILRLGGIRPNIAVKKMIIIDCDDNNITSGYKLFFDKEYPLGHLKKVEEYKFDHPTNRAVKVGDVWKK